MKNVSDVQPRSVEAFITLYFFSKTSFLPLDSTLSLRLEEW